MSRIHKTGTGPVYRSEKNGPWLTGKTVWLNEMGIF
jgi:hypothetical protein